MTAPSSNASLGLYPVTDTAAPGIAELAATCRELGLCGEAIHGRSDAWLTGVRFLEHINYLGCAPQIEFEPAADDRPFTHIVLHAYNEPVLFHGRYSRPPCCPACNKPQRSWSAAAVATAAGLCCEHCGTTVRPAELDWRRSAAWTRTLIEITEVFPQEARPQPALLSALEQRTGTAWTHCWF